MIKNVIAARTIVVAGERRDLKLLIKKPQKAKRNGKTLDDDWTCEFEIIGLEKKIVERGCGVDSLQALLLAIDGIIYFLEQRKRIYGWIGCENDTGLPVIVTDVLSFEHRQRLRKAISRQTREYMKDDIRKNQKAARRNRAKSG
jgi:hypothetical protein